MKRVAVFVDGDNLKSDRMPQVQALAAAAGRVDVCHVYGNGNSQTHWADVLGIRFVNAGCEKNAADMLLSLDAMDLCHPGVFDTVVLASSDVDFMHLAQRLRARGAEVIGVGEAKAKERFRESCTRFVVLGQDQTSNRNAATETDRKIHQVISSGSTAGKGILLKHLSTKMNVLHGVKISSFEDRTWRGYLSKRPDLFDIDPKGPDAYVRYRPRVFATAD